MSQFVQLHWLTKRFNYLLNVAHVICAPGLQAAKRRWGGWQARSVGRSRSSQNHCRRWWVRWARKKETNSNELWPTWLQAQTLIRPLSPVCVTRYNGPVPIYYAAVRLQLRSPIPNANLDCGPVELKLTDSCPRERSHQF